MVFSIIITALVLGITYFHWVQGLFSGIISVVLALVATLMAVGYHEAIATSLIGGKFPDNANAVVLCVTFCVIYGVGRILFDSLIPGNVRLPLYVDAVGGGVCGLIVGILAAGTFAIAMESMPLGPSILLYSRYPIAEDKDVTVNGARRQETARITGALEEDLPDESKAVALWIPADTLVADYVAFQSDSGSLAGATKLRDRHENLVRELFFQRLGMENSAKRSALNVAGRSDVAVTGVFAPTVPLMQMDGENPSLNRGRNLPKTTKVDPSKTTLVVRITVAKNATDTDGHFRFSMGAIRLVANGKDFTPTGVLYQPGRVNLLMNYRSDDFILSTLDAGDGNANIDLVFNIDKADLLADPAAKDGLKLKAGSFLEVKRYARVDLSERDAIAHLPPASPASDPAGTNVVFKKETNGAIVARLADAGATQAQ